jgi:cation transport protein ChaC
MDRWVFGYGSLMWRPGFAHLDAEPARLSGLHRSSCVYSHVHRGTPERPGLVLGLDRGGQCRGMAFRVAAADWDEVVAYLRAREQVTMVYLEAHRKVQLQSGRQAVALTYVVDRDHAQYAGRLHPDQQISHIRQGHGQSGANSEYVLRTLAHLRELGISDPGLEALASHLDASH